MVRQFEVYLVSFDPRQGSEIKKTRPALVISPNEMNQTLRTVLVAPMTTTLRNFPSRVKTTFQGKKGDIALDQMRAVDRSRLVKNRVHSSWGGRKNSSCITGNVFVILKDEIESARVPSGVTDRLHPNPLSDKQNRVRLEKYYFESDFFQRPFSE